MSMEEFLKLPVSYKKWIVERINKEISRAAERGNDIPSKGAHHNTPEIRELFGKTKLFAPPHARGKIV